MVKLSALICALFIYIPVFTLTFSESFKSLIRSPHIKTLQGEIISNPVKSDYKGGTYKAVFLCKDVSNGTEASRSSGKVTLYFPARFIESLYPGMVYTKSEQAENKIIEEGAYLTVNARYFQTRQDNSFLVESYQHHGYGDDFTGKLNYFRALCRLSFKRLMYSWGEAGGFLLALLTGSREYTSSEVQDGFVNSGLAHVIALSGMHLSLFGGLAAFFGKTLTSKKIAEGIQLGAVLFFVWFAGLSPSLFRALLCSLIMFGTTVFRIRRPSQLDILSICFLVHAVIFPEHVMEAAFMLSYFAMAGILLISPWISRLFSRRFFPYAARNFSSSCGAQAATSPVSVFLFGKIMPGGIISGLFVTPCVMIFLYAGIGAVILCIVLPFLSPAFDCIMNLLYKLIKNLVFFFSMIPVIKIK